MTLSKAGARGDCRWSQRLAFPRQRATARRWLCAGASSVDIDYRPCLESRPLQLLLSWLIMAAKLFVISIASWAGRCLRQLKLCLPAVLPKATVSCILVSDELNPDEGGRPSLLIIPLFDDVISKFLGIRMYIIRMYIVVLIFSRRTREIDINVIVDNVFNCKLQQLPALIRREASTLLGK